MLAQLVEDLLHLERGRGSSRSARCSGSSRGDAELVLGERGTRRPRAAPRGGSRASAGRSTARCRARAARARCGTRTARSRTATPDTGSPSTSDVPLGQVPAARPDDRASPSRRSGGSVFVRRRRARSSRRDRVAEVALPLDDVRPGRRARVLEVGHEDARAGVERVDHHLAVDRAGDLARGGRAGRPGPARPASRASRTSASRAGSRAFAPASRRSWRSWRALEQLERAAGSARGASRSTTERLAVRTSSSASATPPRRRRACSQARSGVELRLLGRALERERRARRATTACGRRRSK